MRISRNSCQTVPRAACAVLGILVGLNVLVWVAVWDLRSQGLEVIFFDVGQGDAALIETPDNQQILIDGGPSSVILEKLNQEMPFYDRTIDLIVLTHPERDHLAGLIEVLKTYQVENILWTGVVRDTAEYKEWLKLIEKEGAKIYIAKAGLRIFGGRTSTGRYDLFVLYPFESAERKEMKNTNDTSIVARLVFGECSFLFTGDISKSAEKRLVGAGAEIDADVLKVSHHGSKNSSAEEFIKEVSPEIAVIQAGKDNQYGHPHQETLDILQKYGTNILRTDLKGDITILCPVRSSSQKKLNNFFYRVITGE